MNNLLIEIGVEEIPAGYIIPALKSFKENLLKALENNRIKYGKAKYFGTPRRLALIVENISDKQKIQSSTIIGPPEKIGFDKNGKPSMAAEKFAQKAGVNLDEIIITQTDKGKYLSAKKQEYCELSATILENILPDLILSIPFPKKMRWGDFSISFARPIISLVSILGNTLLNIKLADINSSFYVFGHEFMSFEKFKINNAMEYVYALKILGIIVDIDERKALLKKEIQEKASQNDCYYLEDKELVDTVTNLVEYPYLIVGKFDDEFLELPDQILITAMREHQKYFALTDEKGNLKPYFIAANNTKAKDMSLVAKGHEKVIRARLADAKFFYEVDLESSLDEFAEKLKKVTFYAGLGSMYEKTQRIISLGKYLVKVAELKDQDLVYNNVVRTAEICKADLVTQVVIEFTKLQGVIGSIYAEKAGENNEVAMAIKEHYWPVSSGAFLPDTITGKIVAIADKIDTICGCFSINLIPTGTSDPHALRRQALGIIQIMLKGNFSFSLKKLIEKSLSLYEQNSEKAKIHTQNILEFIKARMANMLLEKGYSRTAVNSVTALSFDNIPDILLRVIAIDTLKKSSDFKSISTTFKRVLNILKKEKFEITIVNKSLFKDESEENLYKFYKDINVKVEKYKKLGDYNQALKEILTLKSHVDKFFDDVMVMVDDKSLKANRLALLSLVAELFSGIADFSKL
ncbi:MAG: glycine--tRNA ligase subunit beta [Desulfobacteraceae bacterium 4572_130]|nr:MAG: glycine--tRNA ligase subunit beta [Desulfobacteraceae bacterium 4572_130]